MVLPPNPPFPSVLPVGWCGAANSGLAPMRTLDSALLRPFIGQTWKAASLSGDVALCWANGKVENTHQNAVWTAAFYRVGEGWGRAGCPAQHLVQVNPSWRPFSCEGSAGSMWE